MSEIHPPAAETHSRLCSKCQTRIAIGWRSWCRGCHAAYQRENRPAHSDLSEEQRRKSNARAYANVYQKRGKLQPQTCQRCGAAKAEKHHEDYTKPLDVTWLCRECHELIHHPLETRVDRTPQYLSAPPPESLACPVCSNPIPPRTKGAKPRKFCTRRCKSAFHVRAFRQRRKCSIPQNP